MAGINWYKFFAIVTIFGLLITMTGTLCKISGWAYADAVLAFGFPFFSSGLCALIWFLFMSLKKKNEEKD